MWLVEPFTDKICVTGEQKTSSADIWNTRNWYNGNCSEKRKKTRPIVGCFFVLLCLYIRQWRKDSREGGRVIILKTIDWRRKKTTASSSFIASAFRVIGFWVPELLFSQTLRRRIIKVTFTHLLIVNNYDRK